jgi:hypothetical protein
MYICMIFKQERKDPRLGKAEKKNKNKEKIKEKEEEKEKN